MTYTPEHVTHLEENEILVVGTNLAGWHLGGAAKQAYEQFGLTIGIYEGLSGQAYAFPTLDQSMIRIHPLELLRIRDHFYLCCIETKDGKPNR